MHTYIHTYILTYKRNLGGLHFNRYRAEESQTIILGENNSVQANHMYVCMYVCIHRYMYVCMFVYIVCIMYVCMYVYTLHIRTVCIDIYV